MRLSLRGEYALRALLVLGLNYDQPLVRIQSISDQQNIPKRFLEQILNDLKSAGIVQSKRGVAGGYRLAKRPEEITLAAVVRHIEGALAPVSCVSEQFRSVGGHRAKQARGGRRLPPGQAARGNHACRGRAPYRGRAGSGQLRQ